MTGTLQGFNLVYGGIFKLIIGDRQLFFLCSPGIFFLCDIIHGGITISCRLKWADQTLLMLID